VQLLADENVHSVVVERLRLLGYEVEWVAQTSAGAQDEEILARPDIGELILITYDRDFSDLILRQGFPAPRSILYSRLGRAEPRYIADRIAAILVQGLPEGQIVTIQLDGERHKPLSTGD
jgi:predicted nuclease of predicted toxin-antitoxin system